MPFFPFLRQGGAGALRGWLAGLALGWGLAAFAHAGGHDAQAQGAATPRQDKPITIVVPFSPGGGTDVLARKLAAELERALEQPVVVDNRAGASGNIGAAHVAHAPADGHTLLMVNSTFAINPAVLGTPGFEPVRDFRPVIQVGAIPSVLVVSGEAAAPEMSDWPALLRSSAQRERPLFFASCGSGTPQHLAGAMLQARQPQLKLEQVPYKGCGPALADVLGRQVPLGIVTASSAMPLLQAGRLRALAVTSPGRSPLLPDVPTVAEQGMPGYALDQWHGLLAPAATPDAVVYRIYNALAGALQRPELRAQLQELGYHISSPEQAHPESFRQLLLADLQRFAQVAQFLRP
ncbi:tripartite tricarboxylate transporter substrate binding protein [Allofranklinella schreckenbergeri]|uniref:Tripartite tricarboxylate transporter substrate binding protein n=1 Tax=Allofranklinella schreckenbergeri TaxID=1076744 RepID=A0A3M6R1R4_9BURK|nr:tripartite tricarboxylate transporter substrate-binding protein [Allofranklinella schreckenbergeri]RMX09167.1 tripartite tricarboxylate transporter substrate binding protein [Allofranklinella schreckenbergeri]